LQQQKVIEKKSVDWSQYFGLDKRRKKSLEEPADEEERKMMERYYRTFALATTLKRKRSEGGAPLAPRQPEHKSLDGMDQKLKVMEDLIVDEAVKFTGAHQGTSDPAQIKKVKVGIYSTFSFFSRYSFCMNANFTTILKKVASFLPFLALKRNT